MIMSTYNGWANYETWVYKLWMDNDYGFYQHVQAVTRETWQAASETPDPLSIGNDASATARASLADLLKEEAEENAPELSGAYADLLNAAIGEIDWFEIADSLLEDAELDGYVPRNKVAAE
jgi:hypothetical protein